MDDARADWNSKVKIFHEKRKSLKQEKKCKKLLAKNRVQFCKGKVMPIILPIYGLTETLFLYKS